MYRILLLYEGIGRLKLFEGEKLLFVVRTMRTTQILSVGGTTEFYYIKAIGL
jgi:hypothetical protein